MSDKAAGFMTAVFAGCAFAGFALAVASAWVHEPVGVWYGLMLMLGGAFFSAKVWGSKS